jgi:hypothetical protein
MPKPLIPSFGDLGPYFVAKLIAEYQPGNVAEAVLPVNSHCAEVKWFQPFSIRLQ